MQQPPYPPNQQPYSPPPYGYQPPPRPAQPPVPKKINHKRNLMILLSLPALVVVISAVGYGLRVYSDSTACNKDQSREQYIVRCGEKIVSGTAKYLEYLGTTELEGPGLVDVTFHLHIKRGTTANNIKEECYNIHKTFALLGEATGLDERTSVFLQFHRINQTVGYVGACGLVTTDARITQWEKYTYQSAWAAKDVYLGEFLNSDL